jgi:hypothetical protein
MALPFRLISDYRNRFSLNDFLLLEIANLETFGTIIGTTELQIRQDFPVTKS